MVKHSPTLELAPLVAGSTDIVPLDPEQLGPMAEDAVRALVAEGESENTIRSYRAALRYWASWFGLRYAKPIALPVPVPAVIQCPRRPNFDPPCRSNIDPGMDTDREAVSCG